MQQVNGKRALLATGRPKCYNSFSSIIPVCVLADTLQISPNLRWGKIVISKTRSYDLFVKAMFGLGIPEV